MNSLSPTPIYLESCSSTNTFIEENPLLFQENFQSVYCGEQTQGKGRQNRTWQMTPHKDLAFSMVFFPDARSINHVFAYTLTAGVALWKALQTYTPKHSLKWPNDIWAESKKLAGILCQYSLLEKRPAIIIGIGINVNSEEKILPNEEKSTSLLLLQKKPVELSELLKNILNSLIFYFNEHQFPFSEQYKKQWLELCNCQGKQAQVTSLSDTNQSILYQGEIMGIDSQGKLLLRTKSKIVEIQEGTLRYL